MAVGLTAKLPCAVPFPWTTMTTVFPPAAATVTLPWKGPTAVGLPVT